MSFIPQSATKTLNAYLTQLGRKFILDGNKEDFQIEYFSLHDDDTNYLIASNIISANTYNTLKSGFVPDITGDIDSCIKSIANATNVNVNTTLSGSSIIDTVTNLPTVGRIGTDRNINTRILDIGFTNTNDINFTNFNATQILPVSLSLPSGETVSPTNLEITNSFFKITQVSTSPYFTNVLIGGVPNSNTFKLSGTSINVPITFTRSGAANADSSSVVASIIFKIEPYRSFLNLKNTQITIKTTISGSGGGTSTS